jgi:hypothetical protein
MKNITNQKMASCPLYKRLKSNGTSFYAFPGAAEDISAAYQNTNYKMYFSKYALLNLPKQQLSQGSPTQSKPIYWDFDVFKKSTNASPSSNPQYGFQEGVVESLRNYVANQEVVIRESRLNNTKYYYDTNALETTTEKIFFKWLKSLNLIDFEPAIPEDEYFNNLEEFQRRDISDDEYFPEYLWKEREVKPWSTKIFSTTSNNYLEIEFNGTTNFRVGDIVKIYNVSDSIISSVPELNGIDTEDGIKLKVKKITPTTTTQGQIVEFNVSSSNISFSPILESSGKAELVYHRLIQYIGEVNGISNVQEANRSYTEVYAHIPDHTGQTPDILFRTMFDVNYKPNMTFPIIPSQYQPEILGAELFNSPIVNTPQNYPGSYFGQFDTLDFTYETANGDSIRRSGDYYGVRGDINEPIVDGSMIDGVTLDFNTNHYVKMNILNTTITNFDQFNALEVNNEPPKDFEFNAILWYYTVRNDVTGEVKNNLYGISFLDNPSNDLIDANIKFPTYKKLVANGEQDGTSYAFSLNLNFNIINENPQDTYNPEAINSMFSMNLFNEAMRRLGNVNDSFINLIAEQEQLRSEILNLKQLLYSQTDLDTLNSKIRNLENLLRLYSTNQMISSDSIKVNISQTSPPLISFDNIDTSYVKISTIKATDLYNAQGIIPMSINVPENRNFMLNFINNDEVDISLPNNDKLTIVLDRDLDYMQSVDISITANEFSSQNKKLDIYMISKISETTVPQTTNILPLANGVSDSGFNTDITTETLIIGEIDLPVFYNSVTQLPNSASTWKDFKFDIDFNQDMKIVNGNILEVPLNSNSIIINNSVKPGDVLYLNNFFIGTASVYDFSGQYKVESVGGLGSTYINLDMSKNDTFISYFNNITVPVHSTTFSYLMNLPFFTLNKGKKIKVTRIAEEDVNIKDRYSIEINDIE